MNNNSKLGYCTNSSIENPSSLKKSLEYFQDKIKNNRDIGRLIQRYCHYNINTTISFWLFMSVWGQKNKRGS